MSHDPATWHCRIMIEKFLGDWVPGLEPYAVDEYEHNMLMFGGVSNIWQFVLGNGVVTAGQALTYFTATTAAIGVGDSTAVEAATQTDLQAATNKLRVGMVSGYPLHTAGVTSANNVITFRSLFDTTQGNFAWAEAGVFNSASAGVGRMLNRKVQAMGTKTSASSWQATFDISIA